MAVPPLPEGLLVRRLEPRDSMAELTALLHRAYAPLAAQGLRFHATWQDEATTLERTRSGECFVAVLGGKLVATLTLTPAGRASGAPFYERADVASFGQLAVAPELQGRGLGGLLVALAERRARETGAAELALDTAEGARHLIRYYARRGYRQVGRVKWEVTNYRSVILSKRLDGAPAPGVVELEEGSEG
jgi:predicted N-acetyltransferase YhbS